MGGRHGTRRLLLPVDLGEPTGDMSLLWDETRRAYVCR
jgi:hypothetical protein